MEGYLRELADRAKLLNKTVVLPEGDDIRVLEAAHIINKEKIAKIILLGNVDEIKKIYAEKSWNLDGIKIITPALSEDKIEFANELYELRKRKGLRIEEAQRLILDVNHFGTMMVKFGKADAMVSGANHSTADTVRPALQIIKSKVAGQSVSACFIMAAKGEKYIFSDCAISIEPNAQELCDIALQSSLTAIQMGIEPKVAFLSYSTYGSGKGEGPEKMREANRLFNEVIATDEYKDLGIEADGEMQADAALDLVSAAIKCPDSHVAGQAKILIFPNLAAGNIAYKLLQRLGGAEAYGPLLQGLNSPVNDLSRGCLVEDIIGTVCISSLQSN
ncbi:MAG: phosphate acetyltransferase [Alphaproteobacteria bacterium]